MKWTTVKICAIACIIVGLIGMYTGYYNFVEVNHALNDFETQVKTDMSTNEKMNIINIVCETHLNPYIGKDYFRSECSKEILKTL